MEIARCMILLGGDMLNQNPKDGVTPAEVVVLRALHGDEAITKIEITGSDRRANAKEYTRLRNRYGNAVTTDGLSIFASIFPNPHARLPVRFSEIGINMDGENVVDGDDEDDDDEKEIGDKPNFLAGAAASK